MPDQSPDTYPGERPQMRDAHPIDGFIHRHMTSIIIGRREGETVSDPNSSVAQRAAEFAESLDFLGIEQQRIRIGTAVAHMDFARQASQLRKMTPEDFSAEA